MRQTRRDRPRSPIPARMSVRVHSGPLLTCALARRYRSKHLVFGKAVRFRHYPVTVSAERSVRCLKPLGHLSLGKALRFSMKRKSGDRPDANLGLFNFDGRVEEHNHGFRLGIQTEDRVVAAFGQFPRLSLSVCLADIGEAHARGLVSGCDSCSGRRP
jgi:hypothetical protein